MQILKCFHSELACIVASEYHENTEVKYFFGPKFLVRLPK